MGLDALLDVAQHLQGEGKQRVCRRYQSMHGTRYLYGASGIANLALAAEE